MKFLKRFFDKDKDPIPTKISIKDITDILKQFEYILIDEGCLVSYESFTDPNGKLDGWMRINIKTPNCVKDRDNRPISYLAGTYKYIEQFKQEEYFQEYIDRIFEEIPKNSFSILILADGMNLLYSIGNGLLVDGDALIAKKGEVVIKSKK